MLTQVILEYSIKISMSDFKNAFDSYKKASAGKTGKSGFSDDKHISEKNKKNTSINNSNLPEHLKKIII